ncbi:hypothetical protein M0805_002916 [Coniferiporia weirii]|nr:hypothetical protein M0805_002916 [Coniferiporia weirii]
MPTYVGNSSQASPPPPFGAPYYVATDYQNKPFDAESQMPLNAQPSRPVNYGTACLAQGPSGCQCHCVDRAEKKNDAVLKSVYFYCLVVFSFLYYYVFFVNPLEDSAALPELDEAAKYRNSGMYWETPQPLSSCYSYSTRTYKAQLKNIPHSFDRKKSCTYTPVEIHNETIEEPFKCEFEGSADAPVYGYWLKEDEPSCKTFWGPFSDNGCQESGKRRVEAPLFNMRQPDGWSEMCDSTPAEIHGVMYAHPTYCDPRVGKIMTGIWDIDDPTCQ